MNQNYKKVYKNTMRELLSQYISSDDTVVPVEDELNTNDGGYEEEVYDNEYYEEDYE